MARGATLWCEWAGVDRSGASSLTAAELRLLPLLSTYLTLKEISERLYVSRICWSWQST
jgi:hypothetical protein